MINTFVFVQILCIGSAIRKSFSQPDTGEKDADLDTVNSQGCLCNVGGQHYLASSHGGLLKDPGLHVRGQVCIDWSNDELPNFGP